MEVPNRVTPCDEASLNHSACLGYRNTYKSHTPFHTLPTTTFGEPTSFQPAVQVSYILFTSYKDLSDSRDSFFHQMPWSPLITFNQTRSVG